MSDADKLPATHWPAVSEAAERNRAPIGDVLAEVLPKAGGVLEVACGTGQHAAAFGRRFAALKWQPTDYVDDHFVDVRSHIEGVENVAMPRLLDVRKPAPDDLDVNFVYCANMIHISPYECTLGLLDLAAACLKSGERLMTYGPYLRGDVVTAPGNAAFDARLRARDPSWGIRDLDDVTREAASRGLQRSRIVEMPANNLSVVFTRD